MYIFSLKVVRTKHAFRSLALLPVLAAAFTNPAHAYQSLVSSASVPVLPDAPEVSSSIAREEPSAEAVSSLTSQNGQAGTPPSRPQASDEHQDGQQKRIFFIIPNFRSVTAGTILPKQSVRDKFVTASQDTLDYSSFAFVAALAGYSQGTNQTPEFGSGGVAYGRYFWHTLADQTIENSFVEFIVPAVFHEDTRYYSLGKGSFSKRVVHSFGHAFVTQTDDRRRTLNKGELLGAAIASTISNAYYPSPERTVSQTFQKFGTNVGIDAVSLIIREFSPDINHKLFHAPKD